MCGIAGFWNLSSKKINQPLGQIAEKMAQSLHHRGPDSHGIWFDDPLQLALAHTRLSIIDLSPAGHQPMISASGKSVISFNGEIYNFPEIKAALEAQGSKFRGHSDTEVILEAIEKWGVQRAIQKAIGMFALAIFDKEQKTLTLIRDRMGKKPLYWGQMDGCFFFASELKALHQHPFFRPSINQAALGGYFRHGYVPSPVCIFKEINKVEPGHYVEINAKGETKDHLYWDLETIALSAEDHKFIAPDHEIINKLEKLLLDAVQKRMVADVPIGAFLSGWVDSSLVTAMMQAQSANKVKTFSIGFHEKEYNEAHHAKKIAEHLGTDHYEEYLHMDEAAALIPNIPQWFDEPFADSSQIPTFLVSQIARKKVTVSLSGDGGDELFAGYTRYHQGYSIWKKSHLLPKFMRGLSADLIHKIPQDFWDMAGGMIPSKFRPQHFGKKAHRLADLMRFEEVGDYYRDLISYWYNPSDILETPEFKSPVWNRPDDQKLKNPIEEMQFLDMKTYLPDDILVKVDRASMAVALESRVPLLDHRVVEFSWKMAQHLKIRPGQPKYALRQILYKYVPQNLIDRPKMGFGVPIDHWMHGNGALRDWAESLLQKDKIEASGLKYAPIKQRWDNFQTKNQNWTYSLWAVLMYQSWKDHWKV